MIAQHPHKGWYFPRSLPHFDTPERPQFITFRLFDALPAGAPGARLGEEAGAYRRRIEAALDVGVGAAWLTQPNPAEIVVAGRLHGCGETCDLHAYVVMPNHVHVLATFRQNFRLSDVVRGWKSVSARRINAALGRNGPL